MKELDQFTVERLTELSVRENLPEMAALARIALALKKAIPVRVDVYHQPLPSDIAPGGWVMVPLCPDENMLDAWRKDMSQSYAGEHAEEIGEDEVCFAYQAMLAAAPKPEKGYEKPVLTGNPNILPDCVYELLNHLEDVLDDEALNKIDTAQWNAVSLYRGD